MAEGVGFEPTLGYEPTNGLANRPLRPLEYPSTGTHHRIMHMIREQVLFVVFWF